MCPPTALPALRGERSWLPDAPPLDRTRALRQWELLAELVDEHIAPVELLPAEPWAWAMTFTRDLGLIGAGTVIAFMPVSRRGPFEAPLFAREMARRNIAVSRAESPLRFDGGNVLADGHGRLLIGVTPHSNADLAATAEHLAGATGRTAYKVHLAGGRFPHLDMAMCELGSKGWLVYPDALPGFDMADPGWHAFFGDAPVIEVAAEDGEHLACNLVVAGGTAIGPEISDGLAHELAALGVDYVATPLDELLKAGGGAHCLTLELP